MMIKLYKKFIVLALMLSLLIPPGTTFALDEESVDYTNSFSASDNETGNVPQNVMDGSINTKWAAEGDDQWLQVALDGVTKLTKIGIAFTSGSARTYFFKVQTSLDMDNWTTVFDGETTERTDDVQWFELEESEARFVRITGYGNSVNSWNNISEIEGVRPGIVEYGVNVNNAVFHSYPFPCIRNDLFYVAVKPFLEKLEAEVTSDGDKLTAVYNGCEIVLEAGKPECKYDGLKKSLTATPFTEDGRMMLSIKDVAMLMGGSAEYLSETKTALFYDKDFNSRQQIFAQVDAMFEKTFDWMAGLYDPESGGFYGTYSGRDNEGFIPGIEQTTWALAILGGYGNKVRDDIPWDVREKMIKFYQDRQDPETGLFVNLSGPVNERNTSRNLDAGISGLSALGAKPLYPLPGEAASLLSDEEVIYDAEQSQADDTPQVEYVEEEQSETMLDTVEEVIPSGLPSYLNSVDAYIAYIDGQDWDNNAWTAGDRTQQTIVMLKQLPSGLRQNYIDALKEWVTVNQNPETGFWGGKGKTDFNTLSGAFKISLAYNALGLKLPNPEKITDSVIKSLSSGEIATAACYVRNPMDLLGTLKNYSPEIEAQIKEAFPQLVGGIVNSMRALQCPDGGFSSGIGASQNIFSGIPNGYSLHEGDIDGTLQMFKARQYVYRLMGSDSGPMKYSDCFWENLKARQPVVKTPAKYCEVGEIAYEQNFENTNTYEDISGEIMKRGINFDAQVVCENSNKYLRLNSINGSGSHYSVILPRMTGTFAVEMNLKFDHDGEFVRDVNDFSYSGISLWGNISSKALSLNAYEDSGEARLIAASSSSAYVNVDGVERGKWTKVKIEFTTPSDANNNVVSVKYYVDGLLSTESLDAWRHYLLADYIDEMQIFAPASGSCSICVDDIKVWRVK